MQTNRNNDEKTQYKKLTIKLSCPDQKISLFRLLRAEFSSSCSCLMLQRFEIFSGAKTCSYSNQKDCEPSPMKIHQGYFIIQSIFHLEPPFAYLPLLHTKGFLFFSVEAFKFQHLFHSIKKTIEISENLIFCSPSLLTLHSFVSFSFLFSACLRIKNKLFNDQDFFAHNFYMFFACHMTAARRRAFLCCSH